MMNLYSSKRVVRHKRPTLNRMRAARPVQTGRERSMLLNISGWLLQRRRSVDRLVQRILRGRRAGGRFLDRLADQVGDFQGR